MAVDELPVVIVEFVMYPGVKFQCPKCHVDHDVPDPELVQKILNGHNITAMCHKCGADFKLRKSMLVVAK